MRLFWGQENQTKRLHKRNSGLIRDAPVAGDGQTRFKNEGPRGLPPEPAPTPAGCPRRSASQEGRQPPGREDFGGFAARLSSRRFPEEIEV